MEIGELEGWSEVIGVFSMQLARTAENCLLEVQGIGGLEC